MSGVQRPSPWEPSFYPAPAVGECLSCGQQLEPGRQAICLDCCDGGGS